MPEAARRPDVTAQQVGGDTILTDPVAGRSHVINATAWWIWDQLDGATTVDEIATRMAGRYAVDPARARGDVDRILGSFESLGLLGP